MAYDHEEQEQLDSLKVWWNQYGNLVTWLLIAGLLAYSAWAYWQYRERTAAVGASQLYEEVQAAATAKDSAKLQRAAADMSSRFGNTTYASMTALVAAKSAFDAKDLKSAKAQLQWVREHGNEEFKAIAGLRLAGVLLDEKAYDEALKTVEAVKLAQFAGQAADRKGDILVAQNKLAEARAAYLTALEAVGKNGPARQLIQVKLEAIGGSVPETKAAA